MNKNTNDMVQVRVEFKADYGEHIHVFTNGKVIAVNRNHVFLGTNQTYFVTGKVKSLQLNYAHVLIGRKVILVPLTDINLRNSFSVNLSNLPCAL